MIDNTWEFSLYASEMEDEELDLLEAAAEQRQDWRDDVDR